ncbi:sirohydrochlorin chelatase [Melghirimyces algeriensis]|uniref:Sirohydrochlorin ferrochelatase n=1 Tax=Melghirimyces algeriensis TaxID=910412 RepID=A0A521F835_9BACL|nr:CbiX/SirB N-terminal domain-containing protein [Melghirimyces algeriensis]SMO92333.1 Sirohydrochlorin ferrochelatase [Melghirimyces algeriensis]
MASGKEGVLVLAHGSPNPEWNRLVENAVRQVKTKLPITVGYLESVTGQSISDGIYFLEKKGVERILTVPLFVSSGSTHLEEIQYALGIKRFSRIRTNLQRIRPQADIVWCKAMDAHPFMVRILEDRVRALLPNPEKENLLLVAHGSEKPGFRDVWEKGLQQLADHLHQRFPFQEVEISMLQVGDVREKAKTLSHLGRLLVLPVFLGRGYFTDVRIRQELEGVSGVSYGETYLPHPLVSRWVEEMVERWRNV